ncbi:MAG TPA: glucosaminidase domain-containing protein [Vicinamibacterales bacterium]|nr:glucosaminidase domain-containing protein [Vicinamibacterales bacterium]
MSGRAAATCVVAIAAFAGGACGSAKRVSPTAPSPPPAANAVAVMGPSRVPAFTIVRWFNERTPRPAGTYAATVPLETLAHIYIEEGDAEGVTGDVAFVQSVVETGWFRFSGSIPASFNNFAGIGATDTNPSPAQFPDARTGVRAQIQHLRAYADPAASSCTVPPLRNPCVDPRFNLVTPKGRAPTWNQFGNGNWASASTYAATILTLYAELLSFSGTTR